MPAFYWHTYSTMQKCFSILLLVLLSFEGISQTLDKDTIALEEVVVTSIRPRQKDRSLTPLQSISREELDLAKGNSVAEAISTFSGITLKDYGGIGGLKTVMVRSLGANHTGVFIDDIQLTDAATGQVDLGKVSTENISSISLFVAQANNLAQPARYYASASVISLNSVQPDFSAKSLRLKSGVKLGSFGLVQPSLSIDKLINQNSFASMLASYTTAHGQYPYNLRYGVVLDTTVRRMNTDIEALNLSSSYTYSFSTDQKLLFRLMYYGSERGLPGAIVFYNPYSSQRLWNDDLISSLQYKNKLSEKFNIVSRVKYSQSKLRYLDPDYLNAERKLDNIYNQQEYYASQVVSYGITDSLSASIAADFFINTLITNVDGYAMPTRYSSLTAIALQYKQKRLALNGNILATYVAEKTVYGNAAPTRTRLTPTFAFGYKLIRSGKLRFNFLYKDIYRLPTFNDLYYTLSGNNSLQPEKAKQFNLGLRAYGGFGIFSYASFSTDVFYNKVTDKIVAVPTKNLFVWSMRNLGVVDIRGFELQAEIATLPLWGKFLFSASSNYTYQRALDATDVNSPTYKHQIPYVPIETFATKSAISYRKLTLGYNLLFNGFRYALGENITDNLVPSWWVSDLTVLYNKEINSYTLGVKGEITNLLNRQYEVIKSFPMPGRGFSITISFTY